MSNSLPFNSVASSSKIKYWRKFRLESNKRENEIWASNYLVLPPSVKLKFLSCSLAQNKWYYSWRYIPDVTNAIYEVMKVASRSHAKRQKLFPNEDAEMLSKVSERLITKETLVEKLAQHVEQVSSWVYFQISSLYFINSIILRYS